ncbi:MAG TPA: Fe2+-dependent dioxygenase [Methylophilaceae bacterium]|nr:Fe2+-dependent dioxygenase [Methylophilaceae bacterium]
MLIVLDDVLNAQALREFRAAYDQLPYGDGRATAGERAAEVKRNLQLANDTPQHAALTASVHAALGSCAEFMSAALPLQISPPLFNRYLPGMAFGQHVDNAIRIDGEQPLRADVSATLMLSGPEEYQGGDLVIADTYGEQRIRLKAGSLVVYPSSSLHRVEAVTSGQRDVIVFWTQSMVRDNGQRATLYRLDQTIRQLCQRQPDAPEIDALMATYNNLLRMWADL